MMIANNIYFESWELPESRTVLLLPPRSRLANLEPIEIGTPDVESLTSYIARLAIAHGVQNWSLVKSEIVPLINRASRLDPETKLSHVTSGSNFLKAPQALNSVGIIAADYVKVVETLTHQQNLHFLTLRTWKNVVSSQCLIRSTRAWCQRCCEEWKRDKRPIYEPLLWFIDGVDVCLKHQRPLETICPSCEQGNLPTDYKQMPCHCALCGGWLGRKSTSNSNESEGDSEESEPIRMVHSDYRLWAANSIGELLAAAPTLNFIPIRATISKMLAAFIGKYCHGVQNRFSRYVDIPYVTIDAWMAGDYIPQLKLLLKICYRIGCSPLDFLIGTFSLKNIEGGGNKVIQTEQQQLALQPQRLTNNEVKNIIKMALVEEPAPSLSEVLQRTGYRCRASLAKHFHEECKQITARYRSSTIFLQMPRHSNAIIVDDENLERHLNAELEKDQPTSLTKIASDLGYKRGASLSDRFPGLCRAIHEKSKQKRKREIKVIRRALKRALNEYPPPTITEIAKRLNIQYYLIKSLCPELCTDLISKVEQHKSKQRNKIQSDLEAVLEEYPPPSMRSISRRFGYNPGGLYKLFPDLCYKIAARHAQYGSGKD